MFRHAARFRHAVRLCVLLGIPAAPWATVAADAQLRADGQALATSAPHEISLFPALHDRNGPLRGLTVDEVAVIDAGRRVDSRELQLIPVGNEDPRVVALLFDRLDTASARNAVHIANRLLEQTRDKTGAVGVWALDGGLRAVQAYSTDRVAVIGAVRSLVPEPAQRVGTPAAASHAASPAVPDASDALLEKTVASIASTDRQVTTERHCPPNVAALWAFAQAQQALPGRKAVVYFTEQAPSNLNAMEDMQEVAQSLNDANVTLYIIDVNPMNGGFGTRQLAAIAMGGQAASNHYAVAAADHSTVPLAGTLGLNNIEYTTMTETIANLELDAPEGNKSQLERLATATGGISVSGGEDERRISRALVANLSSYYRIVYPVSKDQLDGKYHPVLVRVLRRGPEISAQLGYFMPTSRGTSPGRMLALHGSRGADEIERLSAGATDADLTLRASVFRFGLASSQLHAVLALEASAEQLDVHDDTSTGLCSLHAGIAAAVEDASGATVARFTEDFRPHGALSSKRSFQAQVISLNRSIDLPPGRYTLRAVLRDWNTGQLGALTQPFEIAPDATDKSLSDVVLVRSTESHPMSAGASPLMYGQLQIVPNLSGELPGNNRTASLFFELYPFVGDPKSRALYLEVARSGRTQEKVPLQLPAKDRDLGSARMARLDLASLSGAVELDLCLDEGGVTYKRHVALTVPASATATDSATSRSAVTPKVGEPEPDGDQPRAELFELGSGPSAGPVLSVPDSAAMIASARESALLYARSLPNFMCLEAIDRADDRKGAGSWKHLDSIVELLRYQDRAEDRTVLQVDGEKSSLHVDDLEGARSNGEFGSVLQAIFEPDAEARFTWQKTEEREGDLVHVFAYSVDLKHSSYYVSDHRGARTRAAFHGLIFVDDHTRAVRRLVAQTEGMPRTFGIRSSWIAMNYDYVAINRHDYLLPTAGEVGMVQDKGKVVRNELRFSDYRRFGSRSKINYNGQAAADTP